MSESVRERASVKSASGRARPRLIVISPAPLKSTLGNSITAQRYARIFRSLGWNVRIARTYHGEPADCIVGLHAKKSAKAILAFRRRYPERFAIVVLTGTDLYRDISRAALAQQALKAADRLVTLQPEGIAELPRALRKKTVAIVQSVEAVPRIARSHNKALTVCVIGHLRHEKDPLRAAYAVRKWGSDATVRVIQAGKFLAPRFERLVEREMARNPRYRYVGELSRANAMRLLARSDVLAQSSRMEGGANTVCEAIACGIPVIASRISGNVGILGAGYPGFYRCGDTEGLRALLQRAIADPQFLATLRKAVIALKPLVRPERERRAWRAVLPVNGQRSP